MKMNALQIAVVNLGLCRAQTLKDGNSSFLGGRTDLRPGNDLLDLRQPPAMRMRLVPVWPGYTCRRLCGFDRNGLMIVPM